MGILDEAIREHLELKRQHGADDSEIKELEDQAFGPGERPEAESDLESAEAEAPTEFMSQPDLGDREAQVEAVPDEQEPAPRREPAEGFADIQEAPPAPIEEAPPAEDLDEPEPTAEPGSRIADQGPADEEQPAGEHEAITDLPGEGHTTAEREAIAEEPTQMYDVEEELAASVPPAPPEEGDEDDEEDDDFFDEQRLSDELDQALEAPPADAQEEPEPEEEPEPPSAEHEPRPPEPEEPEPDPAASRDGEEDVLEETPDFLEEAPEDDQLWFEQKPPKDFDFDD